MFKMRFAKAFDPCLPRLAVLGFERVKQKGELPGYNYELCELAFSNAGGIPLHRKGWTVFTPVYSVTLYCDVCELPVQTTKVHGVTRNSPIEQHAELQQSEGLKRGLERSDCSDGAMLKNLKKEITLEGIYELQCQHCGRWVAKGAEHAECIDETHFMCRHCADALKKW